jgi:pimeloyl-ACP methyl ester carboxylesterase
MVLGGRADRLASAILLIGLPWNLTPDTYQALPANQKALSQLARRSPFILDMVCRLGWKMMLREGPDFYLSRAFRGTEVDLQTASKANLQPFLRVACRHLVAQGHSAFMREILKGASANPSAMLAELNVPLHWLAPQNALTWRNENVVAAKQMNPRITVETVARAGELLPYQRPDVFVRAIANLASDDPATRFASHDDLAQQAGRN